MPEWFSWENQGGGVAVVNRGADNDLVVFAIDNPPGQNQAFYRILPGVTADGTSKQDWSSWLGVPNWFSWENQGGSIAPRVTGGQHELAVIMVDNPPGQNAGYYQFLPLDPDPPTQGQWEVLPYHSGVLAIHAAVLRVGQGDVLRRLGQQPGPRGQPGLRQRRQGHLHQRHLGPGGPGRRRRQLLPPRHDHRARP